VALSDLYSALLEEIQMSQRKESTSEKKKEDTSFKIGKPKNPFKGNPYKKHKK
jgi:hypothetical protein